MAESQPNQPQIVADRRKIKPLGREFKQIYANERQFIFEMGGSGKECVSLLVCPRTESGTHQWWRKLAKI